MITRRLAVASGLALPAIASAQSWPTRPVTLVVPWAAGGGADTVTRIFASGLEKELGKPVNVVNRTGGNGVVGHAAIATASPDGYTLGTGTSEFVNFKPLGQSDIGPQSFDLISRIATIPAGVTLKADGPWKDFAAFAAALKEGRRGQYTGSGVSTGGSWHLAAAGLTRALGMEVDRIRWVPSQGGAPALQDMVAGGIDMFPGSPIEAKALVDAGQVRVAAVMSDARMDMYPESPTLKELGVDWVFQNWFALVAPPRIPAAVRTRIVEAAGKAHARPEVRQLMAQRGIVPTWESPEAFSAYAADYARLTAGLLGELGLIRS